MNLKDIRKIAKKNGVKDLNKKKDELIRSIQKAEGNSDCFRTDASIGCPQTDCLWKEDCLA
ncbi:MAG: SAP domain-containing protein [Nitrospirae bacterium]|nr:SAP domain-containing protein [Nitrospirota bacterium]